jgi:hypothetical protein
MTTASENLESLIKRFPSEKRATTLLGDLLKSSGRTERYSKKRLILLLEPNSTFNFPIFLNDAVRLGILNRKIGIQSPKHHQNLDFFSSLDAVPEKIYDHLEGIEIEVTPDLLEEIYCFDKGVE